MNPLPEPAARRVALLETLVRVDHQDAQQRVCRALRSADFETAVHLLSTTWPGADEEARDALWAAASELHGDRREAMEAALSRARRLEEATSIRCGLRDTDHRLCATALAYAEARSHVDQVLGDDSKRMLHAFIDNAGLFNAGEEPSAMIAHGLVETRTDAAILGELSEHYGSEAIDEQRDAILRYADESIFSVLRR